MPRWGIGDVLYILMIATITLTIANRIQWATSAPVWPAVGVQAKEGPVTPLGTANVTTPAPTPTQQATLRNIVAYIAETFEPEGKAVVVEAINCFYSESKLNPLAKGCNKNGTCDSGIAQINSVHKLTDEQAQNYKKNIDKAYEIYKDRKWEAWYGKGCKSLAYR